MAFATHCICWERLEAVRTRAPSNAVQRTTRPAHGRMCTNCLLQMCHKPAWVLMFINLRLCNNILLTFIFAMQCLKWCTNCQLMQKP